MDTANLAKIAGHEGEQTGDVYKITFGRDDLNLTGMGAKINSRMGLKKALRANGLNVVAIHQHMTTTNPTVYFLHYWGLDRPISSRRDSKRH